MIACLKSRTDSPAGARQWLRFEYDHQGRRIRKRFETNGGSGWVLSSDTAFAYDGWNLVAELNASSSYARLRTYIWGLDLSTSEQGAGGVGGLLLVTDYEGTTTYHWPAYDGNGNVAALVAQADGSLSARYEYGPFGEAIRATGAMGKKNPIRFSTKYTDEQTGLLYYGYRYYNPTTGRWINRDPLGEPGFEALRGRKPNLLGDGFNLYGFVSNNPIGNTDFLGLANNRWNRGRCCNRSKEDHDAALFIADLEADDRIGMFPVDHHRPKVRVEVGQTHAIGVDLVRETRPCLGEIAAGPVQTAAGDIV
jgi:RHS repeat-associated protein